MEQSTNLKSQLYAACVDYVEQRINNIQSAIDAASESGNDETKSSAGDKHETGRAMMQLEQEKNAKQLHETIELKKLLDKTNPNQQSSKAGLGSIIITNKENFYISISAGKINIGNKNYFAVSPSSPIGSKLLDASVNQEISFNGTSYSIQQIL
jgi:transcription elongation GreA/GreB family factor